jgi:rhodanese-related sulfurtransferase
MRAAQVLETFGFTDVANVRGGFGGGMGDAGWATSGLPVETSASTYDALLGKADSDA